MLLVSWLCGSFWEGWKVLLQLEFLCITDIRYNSEPLRLGFVLITAQWFLLKDQALRSAIWFSFNGVVQVVGGILAYGVSRGFEGHYSFSSWKAIFLIPGLLTTVRCIMLETR